MDDMEADDPGDMEAGNAEAIEARGTGAIESRPNDRTVQQTMQRIKDPLIFVVIKWSMTFMDKYEAKSGLGRRRQGMN